MPVMAPPIGWNSSGLTFVSQSVGSVGGGPGTFNIPVPTGVAAGNWFYILAVTQVSGAVATTVVGFTQVLHNNSGACTVTILKKLAVGTESGNFLAAAAAGTYTSACLVQYQGGVGDVDTTGAVSRTSTTTLTAGSITPSTAGVLLAMYGGTPTDAVGRNINSPPSGMTQRSIRGVPAGGNVVYTLIYAVNQAATSTGSKTLTFTPTGNFSSCSVLMQIK